MAALVGNLTTVLNPLDLTLHFARQPEPDLEFTEEELDQTITTKQSRNPMSSPKKSGGGRPVLCRHHGAGDAGRMAESLSG